MMWGLLFKTVSYGLVVSLILLAVDILCTIIYIAALTIGKRQANSGDRQKRKRCGFV